MTSETVLVTGAGGFLGRHAVARLARSVERRVIAVFRRLDAARIAALGPAEIIEADLTTAEGWQRLPNDVTSVLHLAATLPGDDPSRYADNLTMAKLLVERAEGWSLLRNVVHSSSILAYGRQSVVLREELAPEDPDPYGASKLAVERLLSELDVPVTSLRYSSIYGPGQSVTSVLPLFIERAERGEILLLYGDGRRMQDFIYVEDAVAALELALTAAAEGVYNAGSGHPTSMQALAMNVLDLFGEPGARIEHDWQRIDRAPSVTLDIGRARAELGYEPAYDLRAGLEAYRAETQTPIGARGHNT